MVKRRLADAALMEMRLNERKQQNEHNQKKAVRRDYTANAPECVPGKAFLWTYRGNVYPKTGFWVHIGRQMRSCTPDSTHDASSQWASCRWRPASLHCKEACRNS